MMTNCIPADVVRHLRCPNCGESLEKAGGSLRCARGHNHDIARQGYVLAIDKDVIRVI